MSPLVTIGVPVYNGGRYVAQTLASLLAQDHGDLEIIVADNASTDATLARCREAAGDDPRVRFLTADANRGAAWNYNRLVHAARGPLFKWAAADDLCLPSFVSSCVAALEREGPGAIIAFPRSELVDEEGASLGAVDDSELAVCSPLPHERVARLLGNRFEWHPVFGVMRLDVVRQTQLIGPYVLSDVVFLTEMALRGRFVQVPESLFRRRYHAERPLIARPRFRDQAKWFDTSGGGGRSFPQANVASELIQAVGRAPLPAAEKTRCAAAALRAWVFPHWRHMAGEVRLALRERVGGLADAEQAG